MKRIFLLFLFVFSFTFLSFSQYWNRVWSQDYGVVKDSIVEDVENDDVRQSLEDSDNYLGECEFFDDGHYGRVNSTWWVFHQTEECRKYTNDSGVFNSDNFTAGRDHTGNDDGAMFLINIAYDSEGTVLYEETFDVCSNRSDKKRKYKFTIYVASVSQGVNPQLEMRILNKTDVSNPVILSSLKTGDVPHWPKNPNKRNGEHIRTMKPWSEYSMEFEAEDGDVLTLQVITERAGGGIGNDFAMDDLTLYRWDDDSIPEPNVVVGRDYVMNSTTHKCEEQVRYEVANDILTSWHEIYKYVYCLWQRSDDGGHTWSNVTASSGIDQLSMTRPYETSSDITYRLIVTGADDKTDAKDEALYIGKNGQPSNACAYYSISNTLTSFEKKKLTLPKASLGIDGENTKKSLLGFDCKDTHEHHYISLFDSDWESTFLGNYAILWQYSKDKVNWTSVSSKEKELYYDNSGDVLYYRAILAESDITILDIANSGSFNTCAPYYITDTVTIGCEKCKAPTFSTIEDEMSICGNDPNTHYFSVKQTNSVPVDEMQWYSKGLHDLTWKKVSGANSEYLGMYEVQDTTMYLFLAKNTDCVSDSMFFQLNVVPSIVLTPLQDTTVCIGSSVKNIHSDCIKGNPTSYLWTYDASSGSNTSTGSSLSVLKITNDFDITLQVKNDVCTSNTVSMKILVEDSIKFTLDADHLTLCPNEEVTLKTSVTSGDVSSYQWSINDVPTHSGMTELKDVPTTNSTYKLEIAGNKCPSISQEVFVEASPKIELELSTPNPIVCSDNVPTDILLNPSSNVSAPYSVEGSVDGIDFQDNVNFNDNPSSVYYRLKSRAFDHCPWVYSDTVRIDIEPVLTPAIQPVNSYVCEGESVALEAVDNLSSYHSFAWVKNDKDTLSKSDLALTDIVTEFSKYKFVVSGKACPEVADSAYVGIYMTLPVADPDPIYVCEGESVALEDYLINTFSDFYAWVKNGTDTISRGSRSLTVTPTESCKYECVVKGQCYLEMVETIEIIVEHKATPIIQKIPTLVCEGTTLSFEGNDVGSVSNTFAWVKNGTDTLSKNNTSFMDTPTETSTYEYVIFGQYCPKVSESVVVEVEPKVMPTIQPVSGLICEGTPLSLMGEAAIGKHNSIAWIRNGSDTISKASNSLSEIPTETNTYEFVVLGESCPTTSSSVTIEVEPKVNPTIQDYPNLICMGTSVSLVGEAAVGPHNSVAWVRNSTDTMAVNEMTLTEIPTETSNYEFVVLGESCPSVSKSVTIEVELRAMGNIHPAPHLLCEGSSITLEGVADVLGVYNSYAWVKNTTDTISKGELIMTDFPEETTTYEFVVLGKVCLPEATKHIVEIEPKVPVSILPVPTLICEGTTVSLEAEANVTARNQYAWVKNATDTISRGEKTLTEVPTGTNTYEFVVLSENCPKVSDAITIEVEPKVTATIQEVPTLICEGASVALTGETTIGSHNRVAWVKNATDTISKGENTLTDVPTGVNTYEFVVMGESCPNVSDAITIETETTINPQIKSFPTLICEGTTVSLEAEANVTARNQYAWVKNATDTISRGEKTLTEVPTGTNTYEFVVLSENCPKVSDAITIEVEPKVTVTIQEVPTLICEGTSVALTGETTIGTHNRVAWVKNATDTISKGENTLTDVPTGVNTYEFVVMGESCPNVSDAITIETETTINPQIKSFPTLICEGTTVSLEAEANVTARNQYAWVKNATDTISRGEKTLTEVPTGTNTYEFVVLSENCPKVSDVITIEVEPKVTATIQEVPTLICEGASVVLTGETTIGTHNRVAWVKNATDTISKGENTLTDVPTGVNTYEFVVLGESCPNVSDAITIETETTINPQIKSFPTLICEGTTVSLEAEANVTARNQYAWVKNATDTISRGEKTLTEVPTGTNTYEFVVLSENCPKVSDAITIEVEPKVTATIQEVPTLICEGASVALTGETTIGTHNRVAWVKNATDTISKGENTLTDVPTGVNTYEFVVMGESCPNVSDNITIEVEPKVEPVIQKVPTAICEGSSISLEVIADIGPHNQYAWVRNTDTLSVTGKVLNDTPMDTNTYQFVVLGESCPTASDSITIEVAKKIELTIASEDSAVCFKEDVEVKFETQEQVRSNVCSYVEIRYEDGSAFQKREDMGCVSSDFVLPEVERSFSYRLAISGDICPDVVSNELFVHVDDSVKNIKVDSKEICEGDTTDLVLKGLSTYTEILWISSMLDTIASDESNIKVSPKETSEYSALVKNGACEIEAKANVVVHPKPVILSCDPISFNTCEVNVESESLPLTYEYGRGESESNIMPALVADVPYLLKVTDSEGCYDTLLVLIPSVEIEIPEYFVDDRETWKVKNLDVYERSVYCIYDRFGKVLYKGTGSDDGWNGTSNGHKLPSTDYWYVITIPEISKQYSGHFTLLRSAQ